MKLSHLEQNERTKHSREIERLCDIYPEHAAFVRNYYLQILAEVSFDSTIRTYLPNLISREVVDLIRSRDDVPGDLS